MKTFYVTLVISIALIIGGFFTPPLGVIDGSVLTAVGLLLMFAVIEKIPEAITAGRSVRIRKGDFSVEALSTDSVEPKGVDSKNSPAKK